MENKSNVDLFKNSIEPLLTAERVAFILRLSRARAYNLMQTGVIPTVRIGKSRRVRQKDLEDFISQNIFSSLVDS
jgi:excisionase family DNA binding protein